MDPNILNDLYEKDEPKNGRHHIAPSPKVAHRLSKPQNVSFSLMSPIMKQRDIKRMSEMINKQKSDNVIVNHTNSSKMEEVDSSISSESDLQSPMSNLISGSPVEGKHQPQVSSRFAPQRVKPSFSEKIQ